MARFQKMKRKSQKKILQKQIDETQKTCSSLAWIDWIINVFNLYFWRSWIITAV